MLNTQMKKKAVKPKSPQGARGSSQVESLSYIAISKKAYNLFEKRGRQNAHDWDDWFKAEQWYKQNKNK